MTNQSPAEKIFFAVLEKRTPEERFAYLAEVCGADEDLRRRVERLLHAQSQAGSFMEQPAVGLLNTIDVPVGMEQPGTMVGPYKLLQQIGEGGMGTVFMAEQQQPVRRSVALKIIKPGMDSAQVIARFEAERQALALMDHPNIAKVLDAGTTDSGRPFFVMELVKGVPITKFCDENQLSPRERLELFVPVCQAVQHAHQKGIIHRDLKPSNVLVALYDDKPVPKVIDFGVAKATGEKLTERTMFTAFGSFVGTLEYMSPEQAKLNALDIDTRSDVYALGVLLYELLTGSTPLEHARLKEAALDELLRIIREEEPPKPSTRLSRSGEALATISSRRRTEPTKLGKVLRGELDWIVMKALEKDRTRRYETANGLARDVERFLKGDTVEACPPSVRYRVRKFTSKYRKPLAIVVTFAVLLVLGSAISIWQAVRAKAAEKAALLEQESTRAALEFFRHALLGLAHPEQEPDRTLTLRTALDRASHELQNRPPKSPLVEASIRITFGDTYLGLGDFEEARKHLQRAWDVRREILGDEHPETAQAMALFATTFSQDRGGHAQAEHLLEEALALCRKVRGVDHPDTLNVAYNLGVLNIMQALSGGEIRAVPDTKSPSYHQLARQQLEQVLEIRRRTQGAKHPETIRTMTMLSWALSSTPFDTQDNDLQRAEALGREASTTAKDLFGEKHPLTLNALDSLARAYRLQGRVEEGASLYTDILKITSEVLGPTHHFTIHLKFQLCLCWIDLGNWRQAEPLAVEVAEWRQSRPPGYPSIWLGSAYGVLGITCLKQGKWAEAEIPLRHYQRIMREERMENWLRHHADHLLGACLLGQKKYKEAEPLLVKGYEGLIKHEANIPRTGRWRLTDAAERMVQLYEVTGREVEAARWRKELESRRAAIKNVKTWPSP